MNTITIDNNIYRGAEIYAKLHNISVKSLVEKAILNIVGDKKHTFELKGEKELSPTVQSLIGVAKPSGNKEDIDGKNARMEYLEEKYPL